MFSRLRLILVLSMGMILLSWFWVNAYDWVKNACDTDVACKDLVYDDEWNLVPYCFSSEMDNVSDCMFFVDVNKLSQESDSLTNAIKDYCSVMLSETQLNWRIYFSSYSWTWNWKWDDTRTFDSQQSLFVYALCSSFLSWDEKPFIPQKFQNNSKSIAQWFTGNIAKTLKLQQKQDWKDKCALNSGVLSNDCDMSIYATEIFSAIMSDVFKIKYAQALHVNSVKNFDKVENRIENFLQWYFKFTDEYKVLKNTFPQTIAVINGNQEFYRNSLKTIKLFDNDKLSELVESSDWFSCETWWNVVWQNYLACALHGGEGKSSSLDTVFLTLYYNEILNYRIFVSYYQTWLQQQQKSVDEATKAKFQTQAFDLQKRVDLQLESANQTLQDLDELVFTYPLHIGLLLYQEKIMTFRDKHLSPVITSFYSLSEKLQNVQTTD